MADKSTPATERLLDPYVKRILEEGPPVTVDGPGGLSERIGILFHCMTGPPAAHFSYPGDTVKPGGEYNTVTHGYETLAYATGSKEDEPAHEVAELVVAAMWLDFKWAYELLLELDYPRPILFWRLEPTLTEGYSHSAKSQAVKLRCRVAIPGIEFPNAQVEGDMVRFLSEPEIIPLQALLHPKPPV